ncbi:MAG: membrane protein [Actinomycetota bacterium]|nr:MAG: membrane protein [Actinomycetota bacterium]
MGSDRSPTAIRSCVGPFLRGVVALGQALAIGFRALAISARESAPEEEQLSSRQMAVSMAIAVALFLGLFIVLPALAFRWVGHRVDASLLVNAGEGVFRVALFLGYLALIGRTREIRRVFAYHGAEHKTIAAYEHGEELTPERVDRYSTLHVRCGTNFLLLVMVITIFVFALFGNPGIWWRIGSRIVAIPLIAGLAFEMLRLGARYPDSRLIRALMLPGLWLQKITTRPPEPDMIEVAIASFNEVLRREAEREGSGPPAAGTA